MIERDHRFIKRRDQHMCRVKLIISASAILDGTEAVNMIRKRQFDLPLGSGFGQISEVAE
ncbi:hypothetical protein DS906_20550 [Ruegeria sp. A3M17]|nr:hypothetical protein DS906_20550 [Ruegeria sp. A3M17]